MICPPIVKSPNPSRAFLVIHSLYRLNRIGDKQHHCLTPLPIFTLLVSPQFSRTLTLSAIYKLLINLLSRQSIPISFRICNILVQLTWSNAFCQSMKQTLSSSHIYKVRSDIILSIPNAFLFPFPFLNPN
jgi:hypothetical protein